MGFSCCFTGNRNIDKENIEYVEKAIFREILRGIENGFTEFYAGGALGFDTISAIAVLSAKKSNPQINLHLILPCFEQTAGWSKANTEVYEEIKEQATSVTYVSQENIKGCMQKRNRALVDKSTLCIAYNRQKNGGTAYTIKYAHKMGVAVNHI